MKYLFFGYYKGTDFGGLPQIFLSFFRTRNYAFESNAKVELLFSQYGIDNFIWKEHMRKIFNLTKRPYWHLEDFYIPHTQDIVAINYPF